MRFRYPVYDPVGNNFGLHRDALWPFEFTTDQDLVLQQPYRVATVPAYFNCKNNWPGSVLTTVDPGLLNIRLDKFDLVLVTDIEFFQWDGVKRWMDSIDIKNFLLLANNHDLAHQDSLGSSRLYFPHWMIATQKQNAYIPASVPGPKPYIFEAMLGARRPHRDYIMLAMTHSGLLGRSVVNYRDFPGGFEDIHSQEFQEIFSTTKLNYPYISPNYQPQWEQVKTVRSDNISFAVPFNLYANTHYSIVPESTYTGSTVFMSEKTAKPLLAQRATIWFAPEGFLKCLHDMGFETFSDVIDESYDTDDYHRDWKRFERAWHSAEQLARFEDPVMVYEKLRPQLEHNRNHMITLEQRSANARLQRLQELIPGEHWSS